MHGERSGHGPGERPDSIVESSNAVGFACDHRCVFHSTIFSRPAVWVIGWLVLAAIAGGCRRPDSDTRDRVVQQLASDPATAHLDLAITVRAGVAIVDGRVENRSQEQRALAIVRDTEGVLDVINDLALDDRVIVRVVQEAFRRDPSVATVPVEVTCTDGVVTLASDQTNAQQRSRLVEIARTIDGVVSVIDEMK